MTSHAHRLEKRGIAFGLTIGCAVLAVVAVALLLLSRTDSFAFVFRGWLIAFAIWSSVPVGSMALLMIHRLTGGVWGSAAASVLRSAATLLPLVAVAFVPVLIAMPTVFPWAGDPSQIPEDVARWYLAESWFAAHGIVTLIGWTLLGLVFGVGHGRPLLAATGLVFFAVSISLVSIDWYLSIEPHYVATAFGAMIAIQHLLAALAFTALLAPPLLKGRAAADIGALMLAALMGVVYLAFMTYLVAWYGDLPDKADWFVKRSTPLWTAVLISDLFIGAVLPLGMLIVTSIRSSRNGLRVCGALILPGIAVHVCWIIAPAFESDGPVVASAALWLVGLIALSIPVYRARSRSQEARDAD